jgi:MarR family transcriptional regulator, organic hydroperoxide resistance regulator
MAAPRLRLEDQICLSLYSATNALLRAYRPLLEPLGLTYPQYLAMIALWQHEPQSVTELCLRARLDTGTVTPVLKRLESKGLIVRGRSETDERKRVITLTPAGRKLEQAARDVPYQLACQAALSPKQGNELKALAEALYANLSARD